MPGYTSQQGWEGMSDFYCIQKVLNDAAVPIVRIQTKVEETKRLDS